MANKKIKVLIFLFAFINYAIFADAPHTIRWREIPSAYGYVVELKDSYGNLQTKEVEIANVSFTLSHGKYKYRIGVINKFKKVAKWSYWNDLEVRPVAKPSVRTASTEPKKEGNQSIVSLEGDNIYEGTKVFVVQEGKKIPVPMETTREGKANIYVDHNQVDQTKDYKLVLENANFEPTEVPISAKQVAQLENQTNDPNSIDTQHTNVTETTATETSSSGETDDPSSKKIAIWPLFWRQALLPGWGHVYMGESNIGYSYMGAFVLTTLYTFERHRQFQSILSDYRTHENYSNSLRAMDLNAQVFPYLAGTLSNDYFAHRVDEKAKQVNSAATLMGLVYTASLIHIVISGYNQKRSEPSRQGMSFGLRPDETPFATRTLDPSHVKVDVKFHFYY
ncbi:hypothetical protein [Leptospira idonii]|uniref:DUF5683 domain-containing protein n=1 Tax=Leptospira idonii TaxID=1193500 RepID=A0A4R9LXM7_9LEPT|nr:hypothetical protein [Leptospira idonii]TGN19030.1 hypothetical protein EHS15_11515 [Leptospira idonii]